MFDIGFGELLLVAVVGLLVLGPERLPGALRGLRLTTGRLRNSWLQLRNDIERGSGLDDIRQDLHNDAVLKGLTDTEYELRQATDPTARPDTRDPS